MPGKEALSQRRGDAKVEFKNKQPTDITKKLFSSASCFPLVSNPNVHVKAVIINRF
jgi:hypothetical protein